MYFVRNHATDNSSRRKREFKATKPIMQALFTSKEIRMGNNFIEQSN